MLENLKEDIIEKIDKITPIIKDYNKIAHLFSKDEGKASLAKLNEVVSEIRFLLTTQTFKVLKHAETPVFKKALFGGANGSMVKVRPVGEQYGSKTYVGFLIGDVAATSGLKVIDENTMQVIFGGYNPAIFIPETGTVVMGYESWWSEIESLEELKDITDQDIENVWYVKLLKQQLETKAATADEYQEDL
jgi:hypothetical protein